jgi:hypothetical protein
MANGSWPSARHDGSAWLETDASRQVVGGSSLGWRGAVLFVKGDLAEHCHTLGFTSWSHDKNPCILCKADKRSLFDLEGFSPVSFPHALKSDDDWEASVRACEITRTFTAEEVEQLKGALECDRRKKGNRGRCMALSMLGLEKGDRLEPHPSMPWPGSIEAWSGPATLHFWRRSEEQGVLHRNPLWRADIGIMPAAVLGVDWLHAMSLGIFQDFCASLYHTLIFDLNVFAAAARPSDALPIAVARIEPMLFNWYRAEARNGVHHTRVQHFDWRLLGSASEAKFDFHGAETNGLLEFSLHLLEKLPPFTGAREWHKLCDALVAMKRLIHDEPCRFSAQQVQDRHSNKKNMA